MRLLRLLVGWRTLVLFALVSILVGFVPMVAIGLLVAGSSQAGFPFVQDVVANPCQLLRCHRLVVQLTACRREIGSKRTLGPVWPRSWS